MHLRIQPRCIVAEVIYEERIAHINFRSNYLLFTVLARIAAAYFFLMRKNRPRDFHTSRNSLKEKSVSVRDNTNWKRRIISVEKFPTMTELRILSVFTVANIRRGCNL